MIPVYKWKWQGHPGHFISANKCMFRMSTVVGKYLISTIGEYYPNLGNTRGEEVVREPIGYDGQYYETYIFTVGESEMECGCAQVSDWCEIDGKRTSTAKEANLTHMEMCYKYAMMQEDL